MINKKLFWLTFLLRIEQEMFLFWRRLQRKPAAKSGDWWPSGLIQRLGNIAAYQSITIREALLLEPLHSPGKFQTEGRTGLRYRIEASSDLQTWTEAAALTN